MQTNVVQRMRVTFGITEPLHYASVLDLGRLWERLLRRARVPLAYTQGFNPHPRLQFAAALPVGYTSACELLDLLLAEALQPADLLAALAPQLPLGLTVSHAEAIALQAPSPQASMRDAHYRVTVCAALGADDLRAALDALLAREQIQRERHKKGEMRPYDLRPLIGSLALVGTSGDCHTLEMVLRCGQEGSGRPEEIIDELALNTTDLTIHRYRLVWGEPPEVTA